MNRIRTNSSVSPWLLLSLVVSTSLTLLVPMQTTAQEFPNNDPPYEDLLDEVEGLVPGGMEPGDEMTPPFDPPPCSNCYVELNNDASCCQRLNVSSCHLDCPDCCGEVVLDTTTPWVQCKTTGQTGGKKDAHTTNGTKKCRYYEPECGTSGGCDVNRTSWKEAACRKSRPSGNNCT